MRDLQKRFIESEYYEKDYAGISKICLQQHKPISSLPRNFLKYEAASHMQVVQDMRLPLGTSYPLKYLGTAVAFKDLYSLVLYLP